MAGDLTFEDLAMLVEGGDDPRAGPGGLLAEADNLVVRPPFASWTFYRHGWQSWSDTRWVDASVERPMTPDPELILQGEDPLHAASDRHGGAHLGALEAPDGQVLLLGGLGLGARVTFEGGSLRGTYEAGGDSWFVAHGEEEHVFAAYAALLADRLGARKRHTPRVWCSWYSYYSDIDEQGILTALEGVRGLAFDSFQVDDGWQVDIGEWEANARFHSGMPALAARIRDAGYLPGLWLAPFIAHERSTGFRDHRDWFLQDAGAPVQAGNGWGGDYFALDLTHPAAREWIAERIRAAVGWGFGYLKLDFLFAGALPGRRHDDMPREAAYRSGIELVRAAAGDETYLLACGAPVVPSIGVFDGIRVGPDVAPWWENDLGTRYLYALAVPNTRYAISTSLHRLWLRPVIDTDPDVAYFRSRYQMLDPAQRRLLQDLARLAAFRATSDPPEWLDPDERDALAAFLEERDADIRRESRYRYRIDDRIVDFAPAVDPPPAYRGRRSAS